MSWKQNKEFVITHVTVYDFKSYIADGFVHFDSHIIKAGKMEDFPAYEEGLIHMSGDQMIDGGGKLLLPGFVAGHTHIYSAFARGLALPFAPESFQDILDQLWWKIDGALSLDNVKYSGISCAIDFAKSGVTSIIDHHASGTIGGSLQTLSHAVCDIGGLRGGFCFEASDRFPMDEVLLEAKTFDDDCSDYRDRHSDRDRFSLFGLHASMSLSDDSLRKIKDMVGDKPIHVHVAESAEDEEACRKNYGSSVIQRLDKFGLLNKDSILVHCIHISEEDADLIKERQCYVAMNVTSNMNNSVGLPNAGLFRSRGIPVLIGNDGMTCDIASEYRNTLFSMHHRLESPTAYSISDIQDAIKSGYTYVTKALGEKIGAIEEGYVSDLQLVDYRPYTPVNEDNILGHLLYGLFHQYRPESVWCKGKVLVSNYQYDHRRIQDYFDENTWIHETSLDLWDRLLDRKG